MNNIDNLLKDVFELRIEANLFEKIAQGNLNDADHNALIGLLNKFDIEHDYEEILNNVIHISAGR